MTEQKSKIAVIGSGSWATALVKIFATNEFEINWWIRRAEAKTYIQEKGRNPNYLSSVEIDMERIMLTNSIEEAVQDTDAVLFVIPSYFLFPVLKNVDPDLFSGKIVMSAIKGIIPEENLLVSEFLQSQLSISKDKIVLISGPSHAEEVASGRHTFLTLAGYSWDNLKTVKKLLRNKALQLRFSEDVKGLEYAGVLKNIYAIAGGIAHSLNYGDNFNAVLVAKAAEELNRLLQVLAPGERNIYDPGYLGDLLVTAFSQFSRNRTFGNMVGKGYSTKSALMEMTMIPEGFFAVRPAYEITQKVNVEAPILKAVYHILEEGISPLVEMKILSDSLNTY